MAQEEEWPTEHVGPDGTTIRRAFEKFHAENPQVYVELRTLAFRWKRKNGRRCGMKMLFEVLRWHQGIKTKGDEFKLNNNYHALYARMLMENEPELDGLFEIRVLHEPPFDWTRGK